ncbi:hypothetical protein ACEWY4_014851 [Coilia grayii]|uniref:Uncharacterized protein n=1 Tax=Coilia grayii TaxID=363190 RepID=A0ABD1JTH6_9TELE
MMSMEAVIEAVGLAALKGHSQTVPQPRSSVVRVFLSSTCSDMTVERSVLLDKAYPEIQSFCQSLGLTFEVVDLRWGLRDMVAVDHMNTELCLGEIQSCRQISVGPTFTVLLGNRYGHRPLPCVISEREFELLVGKLSNLDDIKFLNKWYWKDDNNVPPSYILQPITTHFAHYDNMAADCAELRDKDVLSWQYTEAQLLKLLRSAALQAEKSGQITSEQKNKYFKSVTELEIEQGLLAAQTPDSTAVVFVRELPKLRKKDLQKNLAAFTDVTVDGLVDSEAQELLSSLKTRLFSVCSSCLHLNSVELSKGGLEPSRKEHAHYLDNLCEQFMSQIKERIGQQVGGSNLGRLGGDGDGGLGEACSLLHQEIYHHASVCGRECAVFRGRESLLGKMCLTMWKLTNTRHMPLVLTGPSGVGKTALMCKLAQEMRGLLDQRAMVVLRLLGTSSLSSDVDALLRGICLQICGVFGLPPPTMSVLNTHQELVQLFRLTLEEVSARGEMLLLILDSLEQLSPAHNALKLHWLPRDLPANVHLVVSLPDTAASLLNRLKATIEEPENFFELEPLTCEQSKPVTEAYLSAAGRSLQKEQMEVVLRSFQRSGSPLFLRVALHTALQWTSHTHASDVQVGESAQEAVDLLLQSLERKHGRLLVSRALTYIALSRDGLSEAELRDVLSLDDEVLAEVYRHWLPPSTSLVRIPPLLWTRLRHDLGDLLVERQIGGVHLLTFYHRLLGEQVQQRYLNGEERAQRHAVLSDYFQGIWSNGRSKPIQLPPVHTKLNADRKVPFQPLWFAEGVANVRKLRELPYHLLHADRWEQLCGYTIGTMEWLSCKTQVCGVQSTIEDLSLCTTLYECPEMQLIQDAFVLIKPTLDLIEGHADPSLVYTEIFARLHCFTETYPALIGRLCSQCQDWFASCPDPTLIPKSSFLPPPGGVLKTALSGLKTGTSHFTNTVYWLSYSYTVDACPTNDLLVAGSEDGMLIVWNVRDLEVVHTLAAHTGPVLALRVVCGASSCVSCGGDGALRCWSLKTGRQLYCIQDAFSCTTQIPGAENTSAQNTSSENTSEQNTSSENTSEENTDLQNTSAQNTSSENTSEENTDLKNTSAQNTSSENTSEENTDLQNTSAQNTSSENTSEENTDLQNTSAQNTSLESTNVQKTSSADCAAENSSTLFTGSPATASLHTPLCCVVEESAVIFTQAPNQCVKAWHLETGESLYDVGPPGQSTMLGTLGGCVCVLSDGDLLTFYKASTGLESMQIRLSKPPNSHGSTHTLSHSETHSSTHTLSPTCVLQLVRQNKLLVTSKEGLIFQVSNNGTYIATELPSRVFFLSASEDERILLAGCGRLVVVLEVQASSLQKQRELPHGATVLTAAVSSQAGVLVSAAEDQLIRVWCLSSGKLQDTFHSEDSCVTSLAIFGQTVVSASSSSGSLKVWQLTSDPNIRARASIPAHSSLVTISKDGQSAFFVHCDNRKEIFTWDCTTGEITSKSADAMDASAEVRCLELAQQKRLLFCGLRTGTVMIYPLDFPLETLCIPPLKDIPQIQSMAISPHEECMVVAYDDAVCLFEVTARDSFPCVEGPLRRFSLTQLCSPLSCMALMPNSRLLCGGEGGEVTLYNFKSSTATQLEPHAARVTCIALSNWSSQALVGSQDCVQRLWSLSPLLLDHTMEYKGFVFEGVLCAAFSVNDQYIFTGSLDKTIKVWDVASGDLLCVQYAYSPIIKMAAHKDGIVAVSQQGRFIKEGFRCPAQVRPGFNPLQNFQAQFRVTSREKKLDSQNAVSRDGQCYNLANINLMSMFKAKQSNTCVLL